MANEIRINTSIEVVQDVGDSAGNNAGVTYKNKQRDGNADSRSWGGQYVMSNTVSRVYDDDAVCYWKNAVVSAHNAPDGFDNSDWTTSSGVSGGTRPVTVYAVAVEYVKGLGDIGTVELYISGEIYASLNVGESIVIPWHAGENPNAIQILSGSYEQGSDEATVNVMLVGSNT